MLKKNGCITDPLVGSAKFYGEKMGSKEGSQYIRQSERPNASETGGGQETEREALLLIYLGFFLNVKETWHSVGFEIDFVCF